MASRTRSTPHRSRARTLLGPPPLADGAAPELNIDLDVATAKLVKHLTQNEAMVKKALHDVRTRLKGTMEHGDFCNQLFNGLDQWLFDGKFSENNVRIRRKVLSPDAIGEILLPGAFSGRHSLETTVFVNEAVCNTHDRESVISMILHHMIHAYFITECSGASQLPQFEQQNLHEVCSSGDRRLAHGPHFWKIIYTLKSLSKEQLLGELPLDTCRRGFRNEYDLAYHDPFSRQPHRGQVSSSLVRWGVSPPPHRHREAHRHHRNPRHRNQCFYSEYCGAAISRADIERWYKDECVPSSERGAGIYCIGDDDKFTQTPRSTLGPLTGYVELIWGRHRIMVSRMAIDNFNGLKSIFTGRIRELIIPSAFPEIIIQALCSYITKHCYEPSIDTFRGGELRSGPPRILGVAPILKPDESLVKDIQVYKLALNINFEELRKLALKRLNDRHFAYEDPFDALREIYDTGLKSPHNDLRKWAANFMRQYTISTEKPTPWLASNLAILIGDECRFDYDQLRGESAAFAEDSMKAFNDLVTRSRNVKQIDPRINQHHFDFPKLDMHRLASGFSDMRVSHDPVAYDHNLYGSSWPGPTQKCDPYAMMPKMDPTRNYLYYRPACYDDLDALRHRHEHTTRLGDLPIYIHPGAGIRRPHSADCPWY